MFPVHHAPALTLLATLSLTITGDGQQIDWKRAERQIVRLHPDKFVRMPENIRNDLTRRDCTIPQTWSERLPHNVIQGRLEGGTTANWAVLCSRGGSSSILIYRSNVSRPVARLGNRSDEIYLQTIGNGEPGFSRRISVIGRNDIEAYCRLWSHECPAIRHDGIQDSFEEKASTILYRSGDRWIELPGAD